MFNLSIFMITISLILMMSSHPVVILTLILMQTMVICLNMWLIIKTSWFSYILFLIFLGGLMILFVYVVSLASNEKFEPLLDLTHYFFLTMISIILILLSYFFSKNSFNVLEKFYMSNFLMFSSNITLVTSLIMFYLLFTLIVAVKISSKYEGPLRSLT